MAVDFIAEDRACREAVRLQAADLGADDQLSHLPGRVRSIMVIGARGVAKSSRWGQAELTHPV